ncbi:hypothetical protein [Marivirga sp.]|uniref:hypothetical protein n=1 Tax=Marivirga sp. TaxID=2018662 RepID=UPI003DA7330C
MRQNYQILEQFPSRREEEALGFSLFAKKNYWLLHLSENQLLPLSVYDENNSLISFWCFYLDREKLITPFKAPFFTPYFSEKRNMNSLCKEVINYCKTQYNSSIEVTLYSDSISELNLYLIPSLKVKNVALASSIIVSDKGFLNQIQQGRKKRKLKSLMSADDFEVLKVDIKNWAEIYQENLKWRKEKTHQNFMSVNEILKSKMQFPDEYQAFQLNNKGILVGTVFFLKVNEKIIYVYSLIINPLFDVAEPSLLLWNAVYEWAQKHDISIIDMGTSMNPIGGINKNLARYKTFIGGEYYRKYTFEW